jgi:hypothetical protein
MIQKKFTESINEANQIYPDFVAKLGPDHELTMQLLTTRAQSEGELGSWNDTVRDDMAVHDMAVKKQGPMTFFSIATLSDASLAMCRAGNFAEGQANARTAYDCSVKAFGAKAGLTGGTADTLAECLIGTGKLDEAGKLLAGMDIAAVTQLAGDPTIGAGVQLLQGEIAYRKGDYAAAKKLVDVVTPVFTSKDAEAFQHRRLESLTADLQKIQAHGQTTVAVSTSRAQH